MAEGSNISWTDDTFNPWEGCQKVGPGCDGCYAEARNIRYAEQGATEAPNWGPGAPRRRTSAANWRKPLKWQREQAAAIAGARDMDAPLPRPRFVFCASLADVFDNAVPVEWRRDLFRLIRETPDLTWLLLTKRPGNILKLFCEADGQLFDRHGIVDPRGWPANAAIGCTAVNQEEADRDVPTLLIARSRLTNAQSPGPAFTFLSMEPLLGPVDLRQAHTMPSRHDRVDWVITGGETDQGQHKARPAHPDWFRGLRDQCAAAGVPFHHKQNGEWVGDDQGVQTFGRDPSIMLEDRTPPAAMFRVGKARSGRMLDGREHDDRPTPRGLMP